MDGIFDAFTVQCIPKISSTQQNKNENDREEQKIKCEIKVSFALCVLLNWKIQF